MVSAMATDYTLTDQAGDSWSFSDQLDAGALLVFFRGDW